VTDTREAAIRLVKEKGYERREEPFRLASGALSHDYVDGKYAVEDGPSLSKVSRAIVEMLAEEGITYTAVGGLTMGADAFAIGVAIESGCKWFSVRKEPKPRGREQGVEGARITADDTVLLVDDVITTGGSTKKAYDRVVAIGATVVCVTPFVDRGDSGRALFEELGVAYRPLMTYRDLGIDPVVPPAD
jgi:orotate phosphoribosyltransferase